MAFPADHDPYADDVYAHAHDLLAGRVTDGTLLRDGTPCFYLWRLRTDGHEQTGIVAAFSLDDYANGVIRRHELTRPAKVDDRARHIAATCCQTGPALLAYRDNPVLEALVEAAKAADPLYELTDAAGVEHTVWRVARPGGRGVRCASCSSTWTAPTSQTGTTASPPPSAVCHETRSGEGGRCSGSEAYNYFLGVLFPASHLDIRPYDRVVADAAGLSEEALVSSLEACGRRGRAPRREAPVSAGGCARAGGHARLRGVAGARVRRARCRPTPLRVARRRAAAGARARPRARRGGPHATTRASRSWATSSASRARSGGRARGAWRLRSTAAPPWSRSWRSPTPGSRCRPSPRGSAPKLLSGLFVRRVNHREVRHRRRAPRDRGE